MTKKLYHGSSRIIEKPVFGYGKPYNDYGLGFYCTESLEMAKEWGVGRERSGYANCYELDCSGLKILNLNDERYCILNWLAVLLLVSPAISLIAVTLIVRKSAKAQTMEESQQSAVFLVIPVLLLVAGQFTGVLLLNIWILLGLGLICALLAWLLLRKCMARFTYEMLLT